MSQLSNKLQNNLKVFFFFSLSISASVCDFVFSHKEEEKHTIHFLEENERKRERKLQLHGLLENLPAENEVSRKAHGKTTSKTKNKINP
jgi:hypothetical protein